MANRAKPWGSNPVLPRSVRQGTLRIGLHSTLAFAHFRWRPNQEKVPGCQGALVQFDLGAQCNDA